MDRCTEDGSDNDSKKELILHEKAKSVAFRPLPPAPSDATGGSIVLFYQYKEPSWSDTEHKKALKRFIRIAERHNIQGRGRVAPEGVNCTLSCSSPQGMRQFCQALRDDWKHVTTTDSTLFHETDFKITDHIPADKQFKNLSIRKTQELVAYGLDGEAKAPSLNKFAGTHLEAMEYHEHMQDKDTVIIDVRNYYESALGNFQPPKGGAELIDPKMRNSIEWPRWLASEAAKEKINNKKVLMYCTGGIRCERATALLNEFTTVNPDLKPKGVYELRGGIERYIQTFPEGGFWKGKNYLFDKRQEQVPAAKPIEKIEQEIDSKCCLCRRKWTVYRGKFSCSRSLCGVPVIVCETCRASAKAHPKGLMCELCREGYKAPKEMPDLVTLKRKAEASVEKKNTGDGDKSNGGNSNSNNQSNPTSKKKPKINVEAATPSNRLFLSRLPLTITKTRLQEWLGDIQALHWCTDKNNGAFYGSCFVELTSKDAATSILAKAIPKLDQKKKPKVCYARQNPNWPPATIIDSEFPPVGR